MKLCELQRADLPLWTAATGLKDSVEHTEWALCCKLVMTWWWEGTLLLTLWGHFQDFAGSFLPVFYINVFLTQKPPSQVLIHSKKKCRETSCPIVLSLPVTVCKKPDLCFLRTNTARNSRAHSWKQCLKSPKKWGVYSSFRKGGNFCPLYACHDSDSGLSSPIPPLHSCDFHF